MTTYSYLRLYLCLVRFNVLQAIVGGDPQLGAVVRQAHAQCRCVTTFVHPFLVNAIPFNFQLDV